METEINRELFQNAFEGLWQNVADFIPKLVVAIVVFLIGWIIAVLLGKVAWHIVKAIRLDKGLERIGFKQVWERSGHKLDTPLFFYELVKWFFIIMFLMVATDILDLQVVTEFLRTVVLYLPNVFVAAIVLLMGILLAGFVEKVVRASVKTAQFAAANTIAAIAKWAVLVFTFLLALSQLEVGKDIVGMVTIGIVAAAAIAFGLAFGLGGKDHAHEVITKMRKHVNE
ncbi:MAG: hypothetical protein ABH833_03405 [Parcubacteria group bacterium]